MGDLKIFESHVRHIKYLPWLRVETPYIEELENRGVGTIKGNLLTVDFTNSYGNPGLLKAKIIKIGRLWFLYGKAYGYEGYPNGRPAVAAVWRNDGYFSLVVPSTNGEFLSIKIKYYEVDSDDN